MRDLASFPLAMNLSAVKYDEDEESADIGCFAIIRAGQGIRRRPKKRKENLVLSSVILTTSAEKTEETKKKPSSYASLTHALNRKCEGRKEDLQTSAVHDSGRTRKANARNGSRREGR